jgi:hypothetical protein
VTKVGAIFTGTWDKGMPVQGVCKYPDGGKYVGDWKNQQPNGKGKFFNADGSYYEGTYTLG